jgi:aminoglycoside N3'-acetyltransferase
MNRVSKEIKEVIFKHLKKRLSFVGIKKIEQLKNSFNLLNNEIYDSLGYMDIASALEDKNIDLDLSLNRNRFPESLNAFYKIAKRDFKILNTSHDDKIDLKSIFEFLKIKKNDNILVHSSFIKLINYQIDEKIFFKQLQKTIGNKGTIFVLGVNFNQYLLNKFSFKRTPPHNEFGILSKFFFNNNKSVRSRNPFDSLISIGKHSNICKKNNFCSYDDKSPWAYLNEINTKIVLVDVDFFYCSYLHRIEYEMKVPYRIIKSFKKKYGNYSLYARKKKKLYLHYNKILYENKLKRQIKNFNYKDVYFYSISCRKLNQCVSKLVSKNKNYFLKK